MKKHELTASQTEALTRIEEAEQAIKFVESIAHSDLIQCEYTEEAYSKLREALFILEKVRIDRYTSFGFLSKKLIERDF